jgi:hypothetical protein
MLTPFDHLGMRRDADLTRTMYRPVTLVLPEPTSGSNYESFTDSPFDISRDAAAYAAPTFTIYRTRARIVIVQPMTLVALGASVPGVEVGDYLLTFALSDQPMVELATADPKSYVWCDDQPLAIRTLTLNGVGQIFDVMVHARRFSPEFRATGY